MTEEQKGRVMELLLQEDKNSVYQDIKLMPDWIASIVRKAYE